MSEMMCSMCGLGAASGAVGQEEGAAAFEDAEGSTDDSDDSDDADESELPLPLLVLPPPPLPLASASPGNRASPQSLRSSATRSALQGGRCGLLEGENSFFF